MKIYRKMEEGRQKDIYRIEIYKYKSDEMELNTFSHYRPILMVGNDYYNMITFTCFDRVQPISLHILHDPRKLEFGLEIFAVQSVKLLICFVLLLFNTLILNTF